MSKIVWPIIGALSVLLGGSPRAGQFVGEPLFVSGRDGYHTYRIPALAVSTQGTVLAFCEGRKHSWNDAGDIDLLVKRSADQGRTWPVSRILHAGPSGYSDLKVLADGQIACLYEGGPSNLADGIVFASFPLTSLAEKATAEKP